MAISLTDLIAITTIDDSASRIVSTNAADIPGNSSSSGPIVSADGHYLVFYSNASNLVAGDTNGQPDVFRKDLDTGAIVRVSTDATGTQADNGSFVPQISADGRYVVFYSNATNLVAGDTNGTYDIFRKDLDTGDIVRVSTDDAGGQANNFSSDPRISADGRYVVFGSNADNLVGGDTNFSQDIFLKDLVTQTITRVSTDSGGAQANSSSFSAKLSGDGNYVFFLSSANNLVAGDTNSNQDLFRKELSTGTVVRVTTDASNAQIADPGINGSYDLSADGRYVVFSSNATLVAGDTNGTTDIYLKDLTTGALTRVSTDSAGGQANSSSESPSISADGRFVYFHSSANNLVASDPNGGSPDIFRKDLLTGQVVRLSTDDAGESVAPTFSADSPSVSADGNVVVFRGSGGQLGAVDLAKVAANATNFNGRNFTLKFDPGTATSIDIDWGDSQIDSVPVSGSPLSLSHVYAANGAFNVVVTDTSAVPTEATVSFTLHALGRGDDNVTGGAFIDVMHGHVGTDTLNGGDGADQLFGGDGFDILNGGDDNDIIHGGADNDQITGGLGDDLLFGDAGNDTFLITGDQGFDQFDGGADFDTILGSGSNDTLRVASDLTNLVSIEQINGNGGTDVIAATAGNDVLDFTAIQIFNITRIEGGDGNDIITGSAQSDTILGQAGADTLNGGNGNDNLSGGADNDQLNGGSGSDSLDGGDGNDTIHGGADNDQITGGLGDDLLFGDAGNDTFLITGDQGFDQFDGGADFDTILGSGSNDTLRVVSGLTNLVSIEQINGNGGTDVIAATAGNDVLDFTAIQIFSITRIEGGDGNDIITGSAQSDTILGQAGADTLNGGDGNDTLNGGADADTLNGGNGSDLLDGGAGADIMRGGNDSDSYIVDDANDVVDETGTGYDTVRSFLTYTLGANLEQLELQGAGDLDGTGNTLDNVIVGNSGANNLKGLAGNDTLLGDDGNDILDGGAGQDVMYGGEGDDTIHSKLGQGGSGGNGDQIFGGAGIDLAIIDRSDIAGTFIFDLLDPLQQSVGILLADGTRITEIERIDFTAGRGNDQLAGGDLDDTLRGNGGRDFLSGRGGADHLFGGDGLDIIDGGDGNDVLDGGAGIDLLDGGDGEDTIDGGAGDDLIDGGADNDTIFGGDGNDHISGGDGDDDMTGGKGADIFDGGDGFDTAHFALGKSVTVDRLNALGGKGDGYGDVYFDVERFDLSNLADKFVGNDDDQEVHGGTGDDILIGGDGNDTFFGDGGKDTLNGKLGTDQLTGGGGADIFKFASILDSIVGAGHDVIMDFSHSDGDKIDLSAIDANSKAKGNQAFKFIGAKDFHSTAAKHVYGELRYKDGIISGDVNGDGHADFEIGIANLAALIKGDFVL